MDKHAKVHGTYHIRRRKAREIAGGREQSSRRAGNVLEALRKLRKLGIFKGIADPAADLVAV
jgi:hypothetical protein